MPARDGTVWRARGSLGRAVLSSPLVPSGHLLCVSLAAESVCEKSERGEERRQKEPERKGRGKERGREQGAACYKVAFECRQVGVLGTDTVKYHCRKQIAAGHLDGSLDVTSVQKMCCKLTTLSHHRCRAYSVFLSRFSGSLERSAAPRLPKPCSPSAQLPRRV